MFIYFRACEKQQTISNVTRFGNINKTEILKKCWKSLQQSVNDSDTVIIIEDSVTKNTINWLLDTCNTKQVKVISVPEHSWDVHQHTITLIEVLESNCAEYPAELHYIVEDDYLHVDNAIRIVESSLSKWPNFAVTYDYPDRYTNPVPSYVVLGHDRHWRTVDSCTMTILALGARWLDILPELKQAAPTSNDRIFNDIFKQIPCISPMPGLSSHLTDRHGSPLVDWNKVWESNIID